MVRGPALLKAEGNIGVDINFEIILPFMVSNCGSDINNDITNNISPWYKKAAWSRSMTSIENISWQMRSNVSCDSLQQ